jgi:hypothetical protein
MSRGIEIGGWEYQRWVRRNKKQWVSMCCGGGGGVTHPWSPLNPLFCFVPFAGGSGISRKYSLIIWALFWCSVSRPCVLGNAKFVFPICRLILISTLSRNESTLL